MKKQKPVLPGSREYFDQLLKHYAGRATWLVQCKGNLERDDLEYLMLTASKLKDERLKSCIAELVGWGDEERAELETILALGFEAMKLCSPSRLREAAMRVSIKYHMKELKNETGVRGNPVSGAQEAGSDHRSDVRKQAASGHCSHDAPSDEDHRVA